MIRRPDPAPHISERALGTGAFLRERIGEPRENHVFRVHQARVLPFFPGLNERSRPTRRTRDRWSVILAVRGRVQIVLDAPVPCVGDSREQRHRAFVGTADDGVWIRKALTSCVYTLYRVVRLTGVIIGFVLTPASPSDHQPVVERLDAFPYHLTHVLGDGASHDADLQGFLEPSRKLPDPGKATHASARSTLAHYQRNRLRWICETVNARVHEPLHLSTHAAQRTQGFLTSSAATITTHRVGMMVNALFGRPLLTLAELAVSSRAHSVLVW